MQLLSVNIVHNDQRIRQVRLTAQGEQVLLQLQQLVTQMSALIESKLTEGERTMAIEILKKLLSTFNL